MDHNYWNKRFVEEDTPWDIGYAAPAICKFVDTLNRRNIKILIPGAGNGHEVEYLFSKGFTNVVVVDLSQRALDNILERIPNFPVDQLICGDFFEHSGQYDIIIEQTFFCALDPNLRSAYVNQMFDLLRDGGRLVGLMFEWQNEQGPPYGGSAEEYRQLFNPFFVIKEMDLCLDSIKPRAGRELWCQFVKRSTYEKTI